MDIDEDGTLEAVLLYQNRTIEPLVAEWGGQIVKRMGDGWLAEFTSTVDAVKSALAIQQRSAESTLSLRIGVHLGEVAHVDGDIFGSGVNVAARLESTSDPGGIAISGDVRRMIRSGVDAQFHPNGAIELKNIVEPVEVWTWPMPLASSAVAGAWTGGKPRLALTRFEVSSESAMEMAAALESDLRDAFGRQTGVKLVSDTASADFILGGTVRASGSRWRVTVQLEERETGLCAWTERLEEAGDDPFDIQDRLVARISGTVRIRIPGLLAEKLSARPLEEMTVEDLLNHAMGCNFIPTEASWMRSRAALELVLERDAENWMAMTMLCWNRLGMARIVGWRAMSAADSDAAEAMIEGVAKSRPGDHLVRTVRGTFLLFGRGRREPARLELEEALALNPNYYHAIDTMAQIELFSGNLDRANELSRTALSCDPAYPYRHLYFRDAGLVAIAHGDYRAAIDNLLRADHAAPGLPTNLATLSAAYALSGQQLKARESYETLLWQTPDFVVAEMLPLPFEDRELARRIPDALSSLGEHRHLDDA